MSINPLSRTTITSWFQWSFKSFVAITVAATSALAYRKLDRKPSPLILKTWKELTVPLPAQANFQVLEKEVGSRMIRYFGSHEFAKWKPGLSDEALDKEFQVLTHFRITAWFDMDARDVERAWRSDFEPAFDLIERGLVRNPNCIPFKYNQLKCFNGSYVEYKGHHFVAMEAPESTNLKQFYFTLLQTGTPLLVRLTPEHEKGTQRCVNYWDGRVKNKELQVPVNMINFSRPIHFLFTDEWEDNSAANVDRLLSLVQEARKLHNPEKGPLAVHCHAGVGRTGSFITAYCIAHEIDALLKEKKSLNNLSIQRIVAHLSMQRYLMVTNKAQYINLYRFAEKYIQSLKRRT